MADFCQYHGCDRPVTARKGGRGRVQCKHKYCAMHEKRRQLGKPMDAPMHEVLPPHERVLEAELAWYDADPVVDPDDKSPKGELKNAMIDHVECPTDESCDAEERKRWQRVVNAFVAWSNSKKGDKLAEQDSFKKHMKRIAALGGQARACKLAPEKRAMIARRGGKARALKARRRSAVG